MSGPAGSRGWRTCRSIRRVECWRSYVASTSAPVASRAVTRAVVKSAAAMVESTLTPQIMGTFASAPSLKGLEDPRPDAVARPAPVDRAGCGTGGSRRPRRQPLLPALTSASAMLSLSGSIDVPLVAVETPGLGFVAVAGFRVDGGHDPATVRAIRSTPSPPTGSRSNTRHLHTV